MLFAFFMDGLITPFFKGIGNTPDESDGIVGTYTILKVLLW